MCYMAGLAVGGPIGGTSNQNEKKKGEVSFLLRI